MSTPLPTDLYEEVLGQLPSLHGKVVAITGCTTGLGYACAVLAARKGCSKILLLNRASERAQKAREDVAAQAEAAAEVITVDTDLQSLESVRRAAAEVKSLAAGGLHVLANNAGVMAMPDDRTKDGFDVQMQTNQLSHVLLTKLLMPELEKAAAGGEARIVFHSSSARDITGKMLEEKFFKQCPQGSLGGSHDWMLSEIMCFCEGPWSRYHQSKLANSAYAMKLHRELSARGSRVKVMACDPGYSVTSLQTTAAHMPGGCLSAVLSSAVAKQSAEDGCTNLSMACFSPEAESGDFFMPEKGMVGRPMKTIRAGCAAKAGGEKLTLDQTNQDAVWQWCHAALGIDSFF
mmetsp:Transcript_32427/g.61074  ORF Transcript_32427/g.61074 Transcript_32427/m.61074 type:complete len:347 (-) Transcript_32427:44-1084(-)